MGKLLQSGDEWMVAHCLFLPFLQWETTLSLPACCLGWGSSCKVRMSGWWLTIYFSHFYKGKQLWVYLLVVLDGEALAKWGWVDGGSLFISPIFTKENKFESTCLLSWMGKLLQSGDEWMVAHCLFLPFLQRKTTLSLPACCLGWGSSCKVGMSGWWLTVYFSHFYKGKQLWVYLLVVLDGEALAKWGWVDGGSLFISPIFTKETTLSLPACCLGWGSSCKVRMSGWWLTIYFSHFYKGKQLWVYLLVVLDGEALAKWGCVDGG